MNIKQLLALATFSLVSLTSCSLGPGQLALRSPIQISVAAEDVDMTLRATAVQDSPIFTGPSAQYDQIGGLGTGQTADIIGRNAEGSHWVIGFAASQTSQGWVAANTVMVEGDTSNVPLVVPPALPALEPEPTVAPADEVAPPVEPEPTVTPADEVAPPVEPEPTVAPADEVAPPVEPEPTVAPADEVAPPVEPEPTVAPADEVAPPVEPEPTVAPADEVAPPVEPEPTVAPADEVAPPVEPEPTVVPDVKVAPPVEPEPTAAPGIKVAPQPTPVPPAPALDKVAPQPTVAPGLIVKVPVQIFHNQASYDDCANRPVNTICIGFSDGFTWLVEDTLLDWSVGEPYQGQPTTVAIGSLGQYHHVTNTTLVKFVPNS